MAKQWEVLVGDARVLDWLSKDYADADPHPLQEKVERLIQTELTEEEKFVFYARFGERAPHRAIAKRMGLTSHVKIQRLERSIMDKIRKALDETVA